MGVVPSLSKGRHCDVRVLMVTHLLGNLGCSIKNLDQVLQLDLETLGISKSVLCCHQTVRSTKTCSDLVFSINQARVEFLNMKCCEFEFA